MVGLVESSQNSETRVMKVSHKEIFDDEEAKTTPLSSVRHEIVISSVLRSGSECAKIGICGGESRHVERTRPGGL